MKKIAIVVNDSWYAYNMRFNLALSFKSVGYEVVFICPYDKYSDKIKQEFEYVDISLNTKGTNPIEDLKTIYRYYKIYKKIKPDIVLQYTIKPNIYGTIAASMLKIPTINNIAGLGTLFIKQNLVTKIAKWLYKVSQKKASKVFFQNQDDFKMFVDEELVQEEKCDVLPGSGVDINKFLPIEKEDDGIFRFLIVSRMLWAKGIGEYVEAAQTIKEKYTNVEFQLVGFLDTASPTAISKEQMDIWVNDGIVNYLGTSDDVKVEISKADCVVLPSFYREGTPRILLESASMAKPIITTDNVGCRDVVDDGINGYLCEVRNSQDLADKMEMMIDLSEDERKLMGKAGREKIVKEFDEKIVISKYLEAIEDILYPKGTSCGANDE
jgi:glycosyltransferase involved in cell wall biosynthesis